MSPRARRSAVIGWVVMAIVLAGALTVGAVRASAPRTQTERIDAIARTIRCPTCAGESVQESKAAAAENIRNEIAQQVAAGRSDDEIRQYLADRFGTAILLVPAASGVGSLVWVLPVVVTVLALVGLVVVFRRWKAQGDVAVTDDDRALVAAALAGGVDDPPPAASGDADDPVGEGTGR